MGRVVGAEIRGRKGEKVVEGIRRYSSEERKGVVGKGK